MTNVNAVPSATRRLNWCAAAAFFLAVLAPAPVAFGQIQVDILTSAPATADTQATATVTTDSESATSNLREDRSADEAARKIVPAPGTQMQSTEGSTLTNSGAIAAEPSLQMQENEVVVKAGETTETLAVNSGAELLKMLGLQLKKERANEPREMDESTTNSLFDVDAVRRLKGADPTVVYRVVVDETPLPDPMIVPWIRQAKLLQERFDRAVMILGENRVDEGRQELLGIIADFPETDYATQARALLAKLDDLNRPVEIPVVAEPQAEETTITVELSPNIQIGTVIVDPLNPTGNRAMVGGRAYKVGDEIPSEPGHRVVGISETVVQIEVTQSGVTKTFDVPVRPRGATN